MNLAFGNKALVAATLTPGPSPKGSGAKERMRTPWHAVAGRGAREDWENDQRATHNAQRSS